MDRRVFKEMLSEQRYLRADEDEGNQMLFLDNVNSHDYTDEVVKVLQMINSSSK